MAKIGVWLALVAIFAVGAHATTADCSIERIRQQTQKCRDELRDKSTGNITADCRNGVLQEHVDCLSEITTCTDLVGTTELTLALEYGYSSVLLESTTGNTKKGCECSLSCTGGEGCSLSCGCTISFGKRESDITALDSTTCKLDFPANENKQLQLETGGSMAFKPVAFISVLSVVATAVWVF